MLTHLLQQNHRTCAFPILHMGNGSFKWLIKTKQQKKDENLSYPVSKPSVFYHLLVYREEVASSHMEALDRMTVFGLIMEVQGQ